MLTHPWEVWFSDLYGTFGTGNGHRHYQLYDPTLATAALTIDASLTANLTNDLRLTTGNFVYLAADSIGHVGIDLNISANTLNGDVHLATTMTGSIVLEPGSASGDVQILNLGDHGSDSYQGVLVETSGIVEYRTKSELLTDIGGSPVGHTHEHNDTTSKQGGTAGEYYHLTSAQVAALHTAVTIADTTSIDMALTGQQISATVIDDAHKHSKLYDSDLATIALSVDDSNRITLTDAALLAVDKTIGFSGTMASPAATIGYATLGELQIKTANAPILLEANGAGGNIVLDPGAGGGFIVFNELTDNASATYTGVLVSNGGLVRYRTPAEILSDIGGSATGHTHAHNDTTSIQGGASGEYNHLTNAQVSALHAAVTIADSTSIDLTLSGQQISAAVIDDAHKHSKVYDADLDTIALQFDASNNASFTADASFATDAAITMGGNLAAPKANIGYDGTAGELFIGATTIADDIHLQTAATGSIILEPGASSGYVKIDNLQNHLTDSYDGIVVQSSGNIEYRTKAEVLSDIGAYPAASVSGTSTYVPKFGASNTLGNSTITEVDGLVSTTWGGSAYAFPTVITDQLDPTGFVDGGPSATLAFNTGTRIFTLAGTYSYYYRGVKFTGTTKTVEIPNTTALYFVYIAANGTLTASTTPWDLSAADAVPVATLYFNTAITDYLLCNEKHYSSREVRIHEYLHETVGARWASGLTLTADDTTFSISTGEWYDEEIEYIAAAPITTCRVLYRASGNWAFGAAGTLYYYASGGNVYYDNAGTITPADSNKYVAYWLFVTPDTTNPIWVLMGQRQDTTLADARINNTYASLSLGTLPSPEMKLLYRVILRNDATPFEEIQDYRNVSNLPSGTYVATDHGLLTGLTDDDHTQYLLADGTRALTAAWDAGSFQIRAETFQSDVATGTAPFTVASTTVVTNLNADSVDGRSESEFALLAGRAAGQTLIGGSAASTNLTLQANSANSTGSIILEPGNAFGKIVFNNLNHAGVVPSSGFIGSWGGDIGYRTPAETLADIGAAASSHTHSDYLNKNGTVALTAAWDAGSYQIRAETFQSDVATGTAPFTVASTTTVTNLNADLLDGNHASAFAAALSGTQYRIPRFATTSTIGDSNLYTNTANTMLGIGVAPVYPIQLVDGSISLSSRASAATSAIGKLREDGLSPGTTGSTYVAFVNDNANPALCYGSIHLATNGAGGTATRMKIWDTGTISVNSATMSGNGELFFVNQAATNVAGITFQNKVTKTISGADRNLGVTAMRNDAVCQIESGRTDSGSLTTMYNVNVRGFTSGTADAGTLNELIGLDNLIGHYGTHASATTGALVGVRVYPWGQTGALSNSKLISLLPPYPDETKFTAGAKWSIHSSSIWPSYFAGNVGIKEAAPACELHVNGDAFFPDDKCIYFGGTYASPDVYLEHDTAATPDELIICNSTSGENIRLKTTAGNVILEGGDIYTTPTTTYDPTITVSGGTAPQYANKSSMYKTLGKTVMASISLDGDGGSEGAGAADLRLTFPVTMTDMYSYVHVIGEGYVKNGTTYYSVAVEPASATTFHLRDKATGALITGDNQNNTTRSIYLHFICEAA